MFFELILAINCINYDFAFQLHGINSGRRVDYFVYMWNIIFPSFQVLKGLKKP